MILVAEVESSRTSTIGHIMMSLALKVKSLVLASKPQVLQNCPVLGWRTAVFFKLLKFCRSPEKNFLKTFYFGDRLKKNFEDLSFGKHLRLCPCSRALASSILVFGLERVCLRKGCFWPWPRIFCVLGLRPCILDSTSA